MAISYLLIILLHGFATGKAVPTFTRPYLGQTLNGRAGSPFNFTWTFSGGVGTIEWGIKESGSNDFTKNGKILSLKTGGQQQFLNSRYDGRVTGYRMSGQVVFTFNTVNRSDMKTYLCVLRAASPRDPDQYDHVHLFVEGPPIITHISHNQTANKGDKVMLNCTADGNPSPNITWTRLPSNSRVTFPMVISTNDEGGYRCIADNGIAIKIHDVFITVQYAATVKTVTPVTSQSWIGETVKLTCTADGAPTPALSWKNPRGEVIKQLIGFETTVDASMSSDQDFGNYTCEVTNDVNTDTQTVLVQQIKAPGSPTFTVDIEATSIKVNWTKPTDDGGSPITAYRVLILRGNTEIANRNITDLTAMQLDIGDLTKSTNYSIKLFARNYVFEGNATERKIQTKYQGVPSAVAFTYKLNADEITLKWKEPNNNGAEITVYTVYHGTLNDKQWKGTKNITDVSRRKDVVKVEMGQKYKVLVTASNKYGESSKEGKIQVVDIPEGSKPGSRPSAQPKTSGMNTAVVAGAAAVGVLVIVGVIIFAIWWKRRKTSSDDASPSASALRGDNPYELDDGYQDVSASVAAQGLQAEAGPVAEADYAQVDMSKKKRNRRPVTDEYAQVDKSKRSKKPRKPPGELDYAELDDFRPNVQPAAAATAEAAPARPLIRRPVYEGTEYADITQFGVPQPEPTYGNIPKKDVVYSNVQGI